MCTLTHTADTDTCIQHPTPKQTGQLLCPQYPGASSQCVAMTPREESPAAARAMASDLGCKLPLWLSPNASTAQRVAAVVPLLTLEEKAAQLVNGAPAVPRLGLPAYNWWAEALHGVAFSGLATTFPQVIGLGATFNRTLWHTIGTIIANEGRGKYVILPFSWEFWVCVPTNSVLCSSRKPRTRHNQYVRQGSGGFAWTGVSFYAPNINIFRDPRQIQPFTPPHQQLP